MSDMAASNPSIRRLAGRGSAHPVAPYDAHSRSIATVRTVTRCTPSAQFHPEPAVHCRTSRNGTGHSKAPHYNVRPVRSVTREANDPPHYTVRFPAAPPTRFLTSLRPPVSHNFRWEAAALDSPVTHVSSRPSTGTDPPNSGCASTLVGDPDTGSAGATTPAIGRYRSTPPFDSVPKNNTHD